MTWPTEQAREAVVAYLEEHSFDDAQCAACGTVRWEHAAHFLDFLAPLVRAERAAALREAADALDEMPSRRGQAVYGHERDRADAIDAEAGER